MSKAAVQASKAGIGIGGWLFVFWVMSFPLINFYIVAELSIDNLLVPVLIVFWLFFQGQRQAKVRWSRMIVILLVYLVGIGLEHRLYQGGLPFGYALWTVFRDAGYFILPILYITDRETFRKSSGAIMIVAMAGSVTAILVSLGYLRLDYIRIQDTRVGIEALPKATGVFRNFGDVALLAAYTVLALMAYDARELPFRLGTKLGKSVVVFCLFLGLLGTQSRNMLVSMIVAVPAYAFFNHLAKVSPQKRQDYLIGAFTVAAVGAVLMMFFSAGIINLLTNIGGGDAADTAQTRLESYDQAKTLFGEAFVAGIAYSSPGRINLAELVHNLWIGLYLRGGIISVLSMAFFFVYAMRSVFSVMMVDPRNKEAKILGAFIVCAVAATMFFPAGSLIYWFMLGMIMTVSVTPLSSKDAGPVTARGQTAVQRKRRVLM